MNPKHYSLKKSFKIYALIMSAEENFFFIGKTTSPRVSAAYSRHICGRIAATKGYFDLDDGRPELYLLEELSLTTADAYKRVLAWINVFMANGYTSLNHFASQSQAKNPFQETAAFIEELTCMGPLSEILERTFVARPTDADSRPFRKLEGADEIIQMNVRMKKNDKARFSAFCKRLHLNQRKGFSLLLDSAEEKESTLHLDALIGSYQDEIRRLKAKQEALQSKLQTLTEDPKELLKKQMSFLKPGINEYLQLLLPEKNNHVPLAPVSYRQHKKSNAAPCGYPSSEGFMVIKLEELFWGISRKRALFVVGTDSQGTRYRFRYYPSKDFLGFSLKDSPYAYSGSSWYVGYQRAADGAMNLMLAFPLCAAEDFISALSDSKFQTVQDLALPHLPPLDDQIIHAASKHR